MSDHPFSRLDRARWLVLSPYLDQALELTRSAREPWLADLRSRDAVLGEQVEAMLTEHDRAGEQDFLGVGPAPRATLAGQTFGPYTLREPLGRGGMGSVWLADRSDGRYAGRVAVKILNASLLGQEAESRFRREGTFLARLRHRHIAQLIDAGLSLTGQPYLVLEYVDGEQLDAYCDRRRLDTAARVRLLLDVAAAVAHAHANLVVHRDLKPSNVLVDREGSVRLVDFGIAKMLSADEADVTVTIEGQSLLTPGYAAPEQLQGGNVTTATDVYALGVLLYVLLSGRHPSGERQASPVALARWTLESEPVRLSAAAAARDDSDGPEPRAERRGTTPDGLRRALRGDLETIAAKALQKDPAARYPSVEALAEDLRRHLDHAPITARRDALGYRAAKFVRRHRLPVGAISAVVLAAAMGGAGIAWQAREAQRQRDDAQAQLARATVANDFLEVLLSVAAPEGRAIEVGDLLDQAVLSIEKQFAADDPMRAEMLVTVGSLFMAGQAWEKAKPLLEDAAAIAQRSGEPVLRARATCTLASLRTQMGDRAAGDALMTQAFGQIPDGTRYAAARAACLAARSAFDDFPTDADRMVLDASEALRLLEQVPVPSQMVRLDAYGSLAYGHYLAGRTRQADEAYARLWQLFEQKGLERTNMASVALNNWSIVHYRGDVARAEVLCRRAVELRRRIEGRQGIAPGITFNHAGALLRLGRYEEAEPLYEETIATASARQAHRTRFDASMELADLYVERGELARAAAQLAHVAVQSTHPSFDEGRRVRLSYYEGRLALARGEPGPALARFAEADRQFAAQQSKTVLYAQTLIGRSQAERRLARPDEALSSARRALALAQSYVEKDAPSYVVGLARLNEADVLASAGRHEAARASYRMAADHLRRTLGDRHPSTLAATRGAGAP